MHLTQYVVQLLPQSKLGHKLVKKGFLHKGDENSVMIYLSSSDSKYWHNSSHVRAMFIVTMSVKNIKYEFSFWGKLQKIKIIKGVKGQSMSF